MWSSKHEVLKASSLCASGDHGLVDLHGPSDRIEEHGSSSTTDWTSTLTPLTVAPEQGTSGDDVVSHDAFTSHPLVMSPIMESPGVASTPYLADATATMPLSHTTGEVTLMSTLDDGSNWDNYWVAPFKSRDKRQTPNNLALVNIWDQSPDTDEPIDGVDGSTLPVVMPLGSNDVSYSKTPLNSSLMHIPTLLVEYYFHKVCRDCSTFDSAFNPFRTMISNMRDTSASINHVIHSLSASKLAEDMPSMKLVGREAQHQALETVKNECLAATTLDDVSDEVLCTILLLGMTTSWHVRGDLGLEYIALAGRVINARVAAPDGHAKSNLEFFRSALKYWKMIVSLVSGEVDNSDDDSLTPGTTLVQRVIMPHPWTGVSPHGQDLFGKVLRLIRSVRNSFSKPATATFSRASISSMSNAIASAEKLEEACWNVSIPPVEDIEDTNDLSTPPIHHVLTAKAYVLAALLHLYMIFPDVLDTQIRSVLVTGSTIQVTPCSFESSSIISKNWLWSERSAGDSHKAWLRDIAFRIVECVENISVSSSTRVVHPPLLLSVASALTLVGEEERLSAHVSEPALPSSSSFSSATPLTKSVLPGSTCATDTCVLQCRKFILDRLEIMQAIMRFRAIENICTVVREVWRRADAGAKDFLWLDVMRELHAESLFG